MLKKYFVLSFILLLLSAAQAQSVESKKCKTCGKPLKECPYKGKHPRPDSPSLQKPTLIPPSNTVRMDGGDIVFTVDGTTYRYKMIYVSGGTYTMGCTDEQGNDCENDEKPAHIVTVSGFCLGQTEVTQALWKAVMGNNPSNWKGNTLPVENVSYYDVKEFISKLNSMTGKTFRLPTEAEWEYAARGGNSSRGYKYSGSDDIGSVAWYDGNSGSETHPVALKQTNELGLYDMSGNVSEWCNDWWGPYSSDSQINPKGPSSGFVRILRGGDCDTRGEHVSHRITWCQPCRNNRLGFRLAC